MTLCLSVYATLEYHTRQALIILGLTLPNHLGKEIKNPTACWIFACFAPVHVLYINQIPKRLNLNGLHRKVINPLGQKYYKYYFLI